MKKYYVNRRFTTNRFAKDDLAVGFTLQEAYKRHNRRSKAIS